MRKGATPPYKLITSGIECRQNFFLPNFRTMMGTNGNVIGVWLDAMKSGLELWHEFMAQGRIKTMDEVRRIECVYSMDIQSEISRIRDAVRLMGDSDEIGFEREWSEAMEHPIRKVKMMERIDNLLELQKKMRFYKPDLNAYFCGFEDNDNEVNALNLALMDLFTMMSVSLTNVVCWVDGMQPQNEKESVEQESDSVMANNEQLELDETDIFLRGLFGKHLDDFLRDAGKQTKGSDVARLVNSYVREFKLEKSEILNKRLREALKKKGILTASRATWNNIIENK